MHVARVRTLYYDYVYDYDLFIYFAGVEQSLLLLRPLVDLLYQPWMIDDDNSGRTGGMNDWQGETKVLGGNLPQCRFVHHTYLT
jgi:hypothetical protein